MPKNSELIFINFDFEILFSSRVGRESKVLGDERCQRNDPKGASLLRTNVRITTVHVGTGLI